MIFGRTPTTAITAEDALPGRTEPVAVPEAHFVSGAPLVPPFPEGSETVYFGMGCFWGAERIFWRLPGVFTTAVGYQGGFTQNPTYEEVCTGRTGHAEVAMVVYDPDETSLDDLLQHFWEQHDPTTPNRQGNDVGTQYRSAIYTTSPAQRDVARASMTAYQQALDARGFGRITTEIREAPEFFYAEDYHQQYLAKNPNGYCNHGFCQVEYPGA